jgi:hypothetical protein
VIKAYDPITTYFDNDDWTNRWTSLVVTETIVSKFTTYMKNNATVDTIVTSVKTVNQTRTVINGEDQTITHRTPVFTITPMPGTYLTVDAGPTYVIYQNLFGALDKSISSLDSPLQTTLNICGAKPTQLKNWEPTRSEDWRYFIQTYTTEVPQATVTNKAVPLPSRLLQYLNQNLAIRSQYNGSNIATCTLGPTSDVVSSTRPAPLRPKPTVTATKVPAPPPSHIPHIPIPQPAVSSLAAFPIIPPFASFSTGTFLSTTYESTSSHVTVVGCLRKGCQDAPPTPTPYEPEAPNNVNDVPFTPQMPNIAQPTSNPNAPSDPDDKPNGPKKPGDSPNDPNKPDSNVKPVNQRPSGVPITIGSTTYTIHVQQTPNPDRPGEQNQAPPAVVIGSQTLTQGQSTIINGIPVIVPSDGGGARIVVGGTTIVVNNGPTGAPVLTIGRDTVTANPQGQFVVGTETLKPGGPAITVDGSTLSLAPSGVIAIINGVTQTLAQAPIITAPPILTVGGRVVFTTVVGGTTQYIVGDKTLAPGNVVTVDGTTYSVPSVPSSGLIVVDGVTSTLTPGQILGMQSITATIRDGTTAFIFAPGQTLTPGGVLTVSGTTFSMPASLSGSVIVINGKTSAFSHRPVITVPAALTINGQTYTAATRDGTTEFVLAPSVTLRPGQAVTMSGTTYSLDKEGTALVINGKTSRLPTMPKSVSASTTARVSSSAKARDVGDFVWSGLGGGGGAGSTSKAGANAVRSGGLDMWVESIVAGVAGWLVVLL